MLKSTLSIILAVAILLGERSLGARFKIRLSDDFPEEYHAHRVRRGTVATTACDDIVEVDRESLTLRGNLMMLHERVKFYRSQFATENLMFILPRFVPGLGNQTVEDVFRVLRDAECYPLLIGGSVRDQFIGRTPRDVDVEVDCPIETLVDVCREAWGAHNCRRSPGSPLAHIGNETLGDGDDIDLASTDLFFFSPPSALEYTVNSLAYETSGDDVIIDLPGTGVVDACNRHVRIPSDDGSEESWDEWRMASSIKKIYRFWKLREKRLTPFNNATRDYIVRHARIGIEDSPAKFFDFYCEEVFDIEYDEDSDTCPAAQETCEDGLENQFDFHRAFEEDFMEYWDTLEAMLPSTECDVCQLSADPGPCRAFIPATISTPTRECVSSSRTEVVMETRITLRLWNSATSTVILMVALRTVLWTTAQTNPQEELYALYMTLFQHLTVLRNVESLTATHATMLTSTAPTLDIVTHALTILRWIRQ